MKRSWKCNKFWLKRPFLSQEKRKAPEPYCVSVGDYDEEAIIGIYRKPGNISFTKRSLILKAAIFFSLFRLRDIRISFGISLSKNTEIHKGGTLISKLYRKTFFFLLRRARIDCNCRRTKTFSINKYPVAQKCFVRKLHFSWKIIFCHFRSCWLLTGLWVLLFYESRESRWVVVMSFDATGNLILVRSCTWHV